MSGIITPTEHDKAEWSRMAQAAYKCGHNSIGHRYSVAATISKGEQMPVSVFDSLQRPYRQWLIWNDFMFHDALMDQALKA